jgi:hypothetical protein
MKMSIYNKYQDYVVKNGNFVGEFSTKEYNGGERTIGFGIIK